MPIAGPAALPEDEVCDASERRPAVGATPVLTLRPVHVDPAVPAVVLAPGRYVVGSDPASDVRIVVPGVHPRHCLIVAGQTRTALRAFASPTRVNGRPVEESPLVSGDRLTIGPVEMRVARDMAGAPDVVAGSDPSPSAGQLSNERDTVRGTFHPAAERLLNELQDRLAVAEHDSRVQRYHEDYLRRENDALIAAAAATESARRLQFQGAELAALRNRLDDDQACFVRRRRLLTEITAEFVTAQSELISRERRLHEQAETVVRSLTASAIAETELRRDADALAVERACLAEERTKLEAQQADAERQTTEQARRRSDDAQRDQDLSHRQTELESRAAELERLAGDLANRESAAGSVNETLVADRAALAAERDAVRVERETLRCEQDNTATELSELDGQRELLRQQRDEIERARRRLGSEREEIAAASAASDSDRMALAKERADLAERRKLLDADAAAVAEEHNILECRLDAEQAAVANEHSALDERLAALAGGEMDLAWRQREIEQHVDDLRLLQLELIDRERELTRQETGLNTVGAASEFDGKQSAAYLREAALGQFADEQARLSVVASTLAADRAALKQEEARFIKARRDFAAQQEQHREETVRLEQGRRQIEAARDGLMTVLQGGPPAAGDESAMKAVLTKLGDSLSMPPIQADRGSGNQDRPAAVPEDKISAPPVAVLDTAPGYWTPLEVPDFAPRMKAIELDDAHNPESVARYMEQLLFRVREDNPLVPPAPQKPAKPAVQARVLSQPRPRLDKDELRAQTSSLRAVANRFARSDIAQHTLRRRKAELTAKGCLVVITIGIAVSLFVVSFSSGGKFIWQTAAGYIAAVLVANDFFISLARLRRQARHAQPRAKKRPVRRRAASRPGNPPAIGPAETQPPVAPTP